MWILGREILKRAASCKHDREDTQHEEILSLIHVENLRHFLARRPFRADMWWLNLYKTHTDGRMFSLLLCFIFFCNSICAFLFFVILLFLNWSDLDMRALPLVVWEQVHGSGKKVHPGLLCSMHTALKLSADSLCDHTAVMRYFGYLEK